MNPTYYVKNENTLGYIYSEQPEFFNILAGKPQLGGDNWMDGFVAHGSSDKLRPATQADFDYFRVCSKGHI